ncbi:MAG: hypothetical protein KAQ62_24610, partial [Cyclobacteriaceae bacterium]|nr:hypothetical protein [Cyclobacteriaceae bacterium]
LGGAVLAFLVIILLNKIFRLPGEYLYGIGLAALIGLLIQKPGCFFGGCCKGMEVTNFIGFAYADGILRHPLQLYEMVYYGVAVIALVKIKVKNIGSKYFLSLVLFCVVQFFAEFIKDPGDTLAFAQKIIGLKIVQLIYLFLSILFLSIFYLSETRKKIEPTSYLKNYVLLNATLLIAVVFVFYIIHPFLFRIEIYAVNIAFLPALFLSMVQLFNYFTIPRYRWASLLFLILPFFLMSQTLPENNGTQKVYKTIGVGYHGGKFDNYIVNSTDPGSCSGYSYGTEFQQKYNVISIGYSTTKIRKKADFTYGLNASFGNIKETNLTTSEVSSNTIASLNPYFSTNLNWLGIGLGLHLGSNHYALTKSTNKGSGYPTTGLGVSPVLPQAHFRVGPKRFFALEYNFANHFPSALPAFTHEFAIVSGFGARNGLYFKYGLLFGSQSQEDVGRYISGYIPFNNKVVFEPVFGWGSISDVYMLGVSYRFGHKESEYKISTSNID